MNTGKSTTRNSNNLRRLEGLKYNTENLLFTLFGAYIAKENIERGPKNVSYNVRIRKYILKGNA